MVLSILMLLLPAGFAASLAALFLLQVDSDALILGVPYLYGLLALVVCILYACAGKNKNLLIKLGSLPVDIGIAAYFIKYCMDTAQAADSGAMGGGLGIFLLVLLLLPYVFFRIAMGISCARVCAKTVSEHKTLHILLHLIPIADIVSAFLVYRNASKVNIPPRC